MNNSFTNAFFTLIYNARVTHVLNSMWAVVDGWAYRRRMRAGTSQTLYVTWCRRRCIFFLAVFFPDVRARDSSFLQPAFNYALLQLLQVPINRENINVYK